ncbi:MAG: haloacid dehalogenase type II [Candidatus Korobacteraceae bacterium]|jgi:2-haloacid dehalogenase
MAKLQDEVKVLIFDTWGTVVDWRGSVLDELCAFGQRKELKIDWEAFLEEWRSAYGPAKEKVNSGELPWTTMDVFYRQALVQLLGKYNIKGLDEGDIEHLNRAWTKTRPWPDSVAGLTLLKRRYILSPLSNASFAWLIDIARFAGLPFDCIISSENAHWYKPRPEVYLTAVNLLGRKPEQVMLVAAHNYDLRAARSLGLRTGFIPRPMEFGPHQSQDFQAEESWDVIAEDMIDLARKMGV